MGERERIFRQPILRKAAEGDHNGAAQRVLSRASGRRCCGWLPLETTTATVGPLSIRQTPQLAQDATVNFGNVFPGRMYSANLSLSNTGTGPYTINAISIDNPDFQAPVSRLSMFGQGTRG